MGSAIPMSVRKFVTDRDRLCVRCGGAPSDIHHRQRRREGGHALCNVVRLCRTCHSWAHAHPEEARKTGFIVSLYEDDVTSVPIKAFWGWGAIHPDGSIWPLAAPPAAD